MLVGFAAKLLAENAATAAMAATLMKFITISSRFTMDPSRNQVPSGYGELYADIGNRTLPKVNLLGI